MPSAWASEGSGTGDQLPGFLTSFVGRRRDVDVLSDLLRSGHRMVTLVGIGGIGKTRLAVHVVKRMVEHWPDGLGFVDCSGADEAASPTHAMAASLRLSPIPGADLDEQLIQHVGARRLLLLLDGCEQRIEQVRCTVTPLLRRCPNLQVLATCRERIGAAGEAVYPVPPLATPPPEDHAGLDPAAYDALQLFALRAVANDPHFRIGADNVRLVGRICARLDGIPLALELAASRLRVLSLRDLHDGLSDRFRLLSGGGTEGQQSLWTTIDWSYQLLDAGERELVQRLAVFVGGFRAESAVAVAGGQAGDLDAIGRLVDRSLLTLDTDADGRGRYRMLISIREYALERLRQSGDADEVHRRHLAHQLDLAIEAERHMESSDALRWLDRLEAEHDNLLAAIVWGQRHAPAAFAELVAALGWYWHRRGNPTDGRRWTDAALREVPVDGEPALGLLRWGSILAALEHDMETAEAMAGRGLALARRLGARTQQAHALLALGNVRFLGDAPEKAAAMDHYEEALRIHEQTGGGDPARILVLLNLSKLHLCLDDAVEARRLAVDAVRLARAGGCNDFVAMGLVRLGLAALFAGDDREAAARFAERLGHEAPSTRRSGVWDLYTSVMALSTIAARAGQHRRAAHLAGAADAIASRHAVATLLPAEVIGLFDEAQGSVRRTLGAAGHRAALDEGRRLADGEVRALAHALAAPEDDPATAVLSPRELEIVELVAGGLTNRLVASRLGLSTRTVDAHLDHVRNKLGLRSRAQIVRWLIEHGR